MRGVLFEGRGGGANCEGDNGSGSMSQMKREANGEDIQREW